MAESSSVIELIFKGVDQTTDTVKKVSGSLGTLGKSATAISQPFANLADLVLKTDTVLATTAVTLGVVAVQAASKFSSELADLDRFLGEGEGSARDYNEQFLKLSTTYGIAVNDIVKSTADWRAANFGINESLTLTDLALQVATAGQITAGVATEDLKKILAGLSVENDNAIETATTWGDVINQVADQASSDFNDIAEAVATLAPQFNTSGASVEQFVAIISASTDLLQSGSEAADGLKTIIGQLAKPTDLAKTALEQFNIAIDKNGVTQDSFYVILSKIAAKWPELTTEQQRTAVSMLVSSERTAQFQNLMDQWPNIATRADDAVKNATGSMANEVERALATSEKAFASFGQSINGLLITIGTGLEPAAVDISQGAQSIIESFSSITTQSEGPFADLFTYITGFGSDLETLFNTIAVNLPEAFDNIDFSGLIDSFGDLGDQLEEFFEALFGEIDLTTVEGLSSALQTVVNTVELLVRTTEGIVAAFVPFAEAIGETTTKFNTLDEESKVDFGEFIGSMKAIVDVGPGIAAVLIAIGKSGVDMADVLNSAFGITTVAVNALQVAFDVLAAAVLAPFAAVAAVLLNVAEASGTASSEFATQLKTIITTFDATVANATKNGKELKDGWNQVVSNSSEELNKLKEKLKDTENGLTDFGKSAEDSGQTLSDWQLDVEEAADGVTQALKDVNDFDLTLPELETNSWTQAADDLDLSEPLGKSKDSMTAFSKAADEAGFGMENFATAAQTSAANAENAKLKTIEWSNSLKTLQFSKSDELPKNIQITGDVISTASGKTGIYATALEGLSFQYKQVGDGTVKATGSFKSISKTIKETAKDINDATKIANDFKVKMEEIASNERIKTIEFTVALNQTKLQEDTKRIQAAFDSIDSTIENTGQVLGDLYSLFGSTEDPFKALQIVEWIEDENKRRDAALELQRKLIEAQIDEVKSRSAALTRGDALITVNGAGLKPHLEAFMWEILRAIQIQASADMQQFLLGIT